MGPGSEYERINTQIDIEVLKYGALVEGYQTMLARGDWKLARGLRKIQERVEKLRTQQAGQSSAASEEKLATALSELKAARQTLWPFYVAQLFTAAREEVMGCLGSFDDEVRRIAYGVAVTTLWRRPEVYDPQQDLVRWLKTAAKRAAIDECRRRGRHHKRQTILPEGMSGSDGREDSSVPPDLTALAELNNDCTHLPTLKTAIEIILASDPTEWVGSRRYPSGVPERVVRRRLAGETPTRIAEDLVPDPWRVLPTAKSEISRIWCRFVVALAMFGFHLDKEEREAGSEFLQSYSCNDGRRCAPFRLLYRPTCDMDWVVELFEHGTEMVLRSDGQFANGHRVAELRDDDRTLRWICRKDDGERRAPT